jgi:aminocarboxymuconate-semialdehyde decarboxylase
VSAPVIDLHCHYVPVAMLDRVRSEGSAHNLSVSSEGTVSFGGRRSSQPIPRGMVDLTERLRWMDAEGVDVQILSAWIDLNGYELDPKDGAWYARALNEATVRTLESHEDRFRAMAAVPLQAPELAANELRYAVVELGMVAVEIATSVLGDELDAPALEPFWAAAEALDTLVLVHPTFDSIGFERLQRYFLHNAVSNPAEETVAASHLVLGGVLERHPRLTVCLTHGGGFLPYQIGRLDRVFDAKPELAAQKITRPPSSFLSRFYYDTVVHSAESLRFLAERVGADRVVLGSDFPFPMGDLRPVDTVRKAGFEGAVEEGILGGNALDALTVQRGLPA